MKKIIYLIPAVMILFFACSKTNNTPSTSGGTGTTGTATTGGTTNMVKTILALSYNNKITAKAKDSVITNYTYDQQNRPVTIIREAYDSTGKPVDTTAYQFSYSANIITVAEYDHGSNTALQQKIYYANASTAYLDSVWIQHFSGTWQTTQKNVYAYGTDGYVSTVIQTAYTPGSNAATVSTFKYSWVNGDLQSQTFPNSAAAVTGGTFTYTYYNQKIAPVASSDPSTYAYKGLYSADFIKTINTQTTFQSNIIASTATSATFSSDAGRLTKDTLTTTSAGKTTYVTGGYTYY